MISSKEEIERKLSLPVVKVSIGCGLHWKQPFEDWINIDGLENDHTDMVCEFGKIDLPDKSVDYLELGDVIEHVELYNRDRILKEWFRILKIGGRVHISTPNMHRAMVEYTLRTIFGTDIPSGLFKVVGSDSYGKTYQADFALPDSQGANPLVAAKQQIFAWQTTKYESHFDCYTVETLRKVLEDCGFGEIDFSESPGVDQSNDKSMSWWLCCTAKKLKNI